MKNPKSNELEGIEFSIKPTTLLAEDLNGIVINEILPDPNGTNNFDTDGDGTAEDSDEFVELFNSGGTAVDISGWTIGENNNNTAFTFPAGTIIQPGEHVVVVQAWGGPGADPIPEWVFEGGYSLNNGGDAVFLSDGVTTISASYGSDMTGGDYFGNDIDGLSRSRVPDGSDTIMTTTPTPECFLHGTQIATSEGSKKVEDLVAGDIVVSQEGDEIPVKWVGVQSVSIDSDIPAPICIKKNAIAANMPAKDLFVSRDHALLIEGLLINAGALVNGKTIHESPMTEDFKYYHVELDQHAILMAEGMPAESYLPQREDRDTFDNGHEIAGEAKIMLFPLDFPRISSSYKVPQQIVNKLNQRAEILKTA